MKNEIGGIHPAILASIDPEMPKKRNVLFLDDRSKRFSAAMEKYKNDNLTIVCHVPECIDLLRSGQHKWDIVHLDHDLNLEVFVDSTRKDCGMEVVRWLCSSTLSSALAERCEFIVHSKNHYSSPKMVEMLKRNGFNARWELLYD